MADTDGEAARGSRRLLFRVDRWMRLLHLYSGLFLVPWMLVYAASAFILNHGPMIREWLDVKPMKLEQVDTIDFVPTDDFPKAQKEQAAAILDAIDLQGGYRVLERQSNARQLKIHRICARGNYIVTWNRVESNISIQQQRPVSTIWFINFLHFKGGYGLSHPVHTLWAVVVDLVAISLVFWVISGIYLWARRPKRLSGGIFLFAGCTLFIVLVVAMCQ